MISAHYGVGGMRYELQHNERRLKYCTLGDEIHFKGKSTRTAREDGASRSSEVLTISHKLVCTSVSACLDNDTRYD